MIEEFKKLIKDYDAAHVAVWLKIKDTRTINTWASRGQIPYKYLDDVAKLIKKKGKK